MVGEYPCRTCKLHTERKGVVTDRGSNPRPSHCEAGSLTTAPCCAAFDSIPVNWEDRPWAEDMVGLLFYTYSIHLIHWKGSLVPCSAVSWTQRFRDVPLHGSAWFLYLIPALSPFRTCKGMRTRCETFYVFPWSYIGGTPDAHQSLHWCSCGVIWKNWKGKTSFLHR